MNNTRKVTKKNTETEYDNLPSQIKQIQDTLNAFSTINLHSKNEPLLQAIHNFKQHTESASNKSQELTSILQRINQDWIHTRVNFQKTIDSFLQAQQTFQVVQLVRDEIVKSQKVLLLEQQFNQIAYHIQTNLSSTIFDVVGKISAISLSHSMQWATIEKLNTVPIKIREVPFREGILSALIIEEESTSQITEVTKERDEALEVISQNIYTLTHEALKVLAPVTGPHKLLPPLS
jgi:hypothetical protein